MELELTDDNVAGLTSELGRLEGKVRADIVAQGIEDDDVTVTFKAQLRYQGTDSTLLCDWGDVADVVRDFDTRHRQQYGFTMEGKALVVESVVVEASAPTGSVDDVTLPPPPPGHTLEPVTTVDAYMDGEMRPTHVYAREAMEVGDKVAGPAIITEPTGTNVVECGWEVELSSRGNLIMRRVVAKAKQSAIGTQVRVG